MLLVIALVIGLAGAWIYAGCPLPRVSASGPDRVGRDVAVSPAPERGASPAGP